MRSLIIFIVLQVVSSILVQGAESKAASDWKQNLAKAGFSAAEIKTLATDKVLVLRHEVRQCFSAYMDSSYPSFVTSDAVLNAYHVLYEETLRQMEERQVRHLRTLSQDLWHLLATAERMYRGDAVQIAAAKQRAQFTIGVALRLQGDELGACEASLRQAIETEVAVIEKAEGTHKPALLGPPEPDFIALDYTLFRPVGIYAASTRLQPYFRALRWLQLVPFRLKHPEELLAYHMLEMVKTSPHGYGAVKVDAALLPIGCDAATHERLNYALSRRGRLAGFFGLAFDERDLTHLVVSRQDQLPVQLDADFAKRHAEELSWMQNAVSNPGNDRVRQTVPDSKDLEFHVLGAFHKTEEAALNHLGRLADDSSKRSLGLEFTGWLGFPKAESLLKKQLGAKAVNGLAPLRPYLEDYGDPKLAAIPWWRRISDGYRDVGLQYRAALRVLAEVDRRAPSFMQGEAWRAKSLQTAASSWAQTRHPAALQSQFEFHVPRGTTGEKGFVEPVPDFFRRMARVAGLLGSISAEAEGNSDPVEPAIEWAKEVGRMLREAASKTMTQSEIGSEMMWANEELAKYHGYGSTIDSDKATQADLIKLAAELDALGVELERDAKPGTTLWEKVQHQRMHLAGRWHDLEVLCFKLAILAEKQLQQVPLDDNDGQLIKGICYDLSVTMFYSGAALKHPADDAPRIARIASDPQNGSVLQVGIGRPRLLLVLYPWQGKEILCQGVVMPYHEVREKQALTDAEWRQCQSGNSREGIPEWLRKLVPADEIVVKEREH